jgi:hypothetical protein
MPSSLAIVHHGVGDVGDSACIARAFWRLNASSLIGSSGTSAKSAGVGNACNTVSRVTDCAPNRSDNRFNNTIPRSRLPVSTRPS